MKRFLLLVIIMSVFTMPFGSVGAVGLDAGNGNVELDEENFSEMEHHEINRVLGQANRFAEYREVREFARDKGFAVEREGLVGVEVDDGVYGVTYGNYKEDTEQALFVNILYDSNNKELLGLNSVVFHGYDVDTETYDTVEGYTLERGFIEEMTKEELTTQNNDGGFGTLGAVEHICGLGGIAYCTYAGFMIGIGGLMPWFGGFYGAACAVVFYFGCP